MNAQTNSTPTLRNLTDSAIHSTVDDGGLTPTMSSREIADLCEARHNDVAVTIERLFKNEVLRESRKTTRTFRPEGGGRPTAVYDLTKRDTLVVVSGYNDVVRARIIDRWMELEASTQTLTPAEAHLEQAKLMVAMERRQLAIQAKQEEHAVAIKQNTDRLDQIETASDYFTCIGYARYTGKGSIDLRTAAELGRRATRRANQLGVRITKIPDPRFGMISQYPKAILDFAWEECFPPVAAVQ